MTPQNSEHPLLILTTAQLSQLPLLALCVVALRSLSHTYPSSRNYAQRVSLIIYFANLVLTQLRVVPVRRCNREWWREGDGSVWLQFAVQRQYRGKETCSGMWMLTFIRSLERDLDGRLILIVPFCNWEFWGKESYTWTTRSLRATLIENPTGGNDGIGEQRHRELQGCRMPSVRMSPVATAGGVGCSVSLRLLLCASGVVLAISFGARSIWRFLVEHPCP